MKMFTEIPEVFLHRDVVDFRKLINGLTGIVEYELERRRTSSCLITTIAAQPNVLLNSLKVITVTYKLMVMLLTEKQKPYWLVTWRMHVVNL